MESITSTKRTVLIRSGKKLTDKTPNEVATEVKRQCSNYTLEAVQLIPGGDIFATFTEPEAKREIKKAAGVRLFDLWCGTVDGGLIKTFVQIHHYPYEFPWEPLIDVMNGYGKVHSYRYQHYSDLGGVSTGTRIFVMTLEKEVPRNLFCRGPIKSWYRGQKLQCDICQGEHKAVDCPWKGRCKRCWEVGHLQRECVNERASRPWLVAERDGESRVDKAAYPTPAEAAGLSSATPAPGVPVSVESTHDPTRAVPPSAEPVAQDELATVSLPTDTADGASPSTSAAHAIADVAGPSISSTESVVSGVASPSPTPIINKKGFLENAKTNLKKVIKGNNEEINDNNNNVVNSNNEILTENNVNEKVINSTNEITKSKIPKATVKKDPPPPKIVQESEVDSVPDSQEDGSPMDEEMEESPEDTEMESAPKGAVSRVRREVKRLVSPRGKSLLSGAVPAKRSGGAKVSQEALSKADRRKSAKQLSLSQ